MKNKKENQFTDSYTKELKEYLKQVSDNLELNKEHSYEKSFFENSNQYRILKILDESRAYLKRVAFESGDSETLIFPINYIDNGDRLVRIVEYPTLDKKLAPKVFYAFYFPAEKRLDRIVFPIDDDYIDVFIEVE